MAHGNLHGIKKSRNLVKHGGKGTSCRATGVKFELVRCREEKVGHADFRGRKRFSFRAIVLTDGHTRGQAWDFIILD